MVMKLVFFTTPVLSVKETIIYIKKKKPTKLFPFLPPEGFFVSRLSVGAKHLLVLWRSSSLAIQMLRNLPVCIIKQSVSSLCISAEVEIFILL